MDRRCELQDARAGTEGFVQMIDLWGLTVWKMSRRQLCQSEGGVAVIERSEAE